MQMKEAFICTRGTATRSQKSRAPFAPEMSPVSGVILTKMLLFERRGGGQRQRSWWQLSSALRM